MIKEMMYIMLAIVLAISFTAVVILNQASFGKAPSGERLKRIEQSANCKDGILFIFELPYD